MRITARSSAMCTKGEMVIHSNLPRMKNRLIFPTCLPEGTMYRLWQLTFTGIREFSNMLYHMACLELRGYMIVKIVCFRF